LFFGFNFDFQNFLAFIVAAINAGAVAYNRRLAMGTKLGLGLGYAKMRRPS